MVLDAIGTRVIVVLSEMCGIPQTAFQNNLALAELGVAAQDSSALRLKLEQRYNMTVTNEAALNVAFQRKIFRRK